MPDATVSFALATSDDVAGMLAIYAPLVRDTTVSWELEPPSHEELRARVEQTMADGFPWIVARDAETVLGYAYAHPFRARRGYRFTCESSIYLHPSARGQGPATRLYGVLLETLRRQGFAVVVAGIALPNESSIRLHERMGFRRVGTFEGIGHKHERSLDAMFLQRELTPRVHPSGDAPLPFSALGALRFD